MEPWQIENFTKKVCGMTNLKGAEAVRKKALLNLSSFSHPDVMDCDDRAEFARRLAVQHGYTAMTHIQATTVGPHRYLTISKDGKDYPILRSPFAN